MSFLNARRAGVALVRRCQSHQPATEFRREFFRDRAEGEAPVQVIAFIVGSMPDLHRLNAKLIVKGVHRVESLAEAAFRYSDLHDEREVAGDDLAAWSAFVACSHFWRTFLRVVTVMIGRGMLPVVQPSLIPLRAGPAPMGQKPTIAVQQPNVGTLMLGIPEPMSA